MQREATHIVRQNLSNSHLLINRPIANNYSNNITYRGVQELLQPITETVLEEEEGVEFDAVYIGNRTGLSGGWRGFSMHHDLEDGDSLVFELAEPDRFKVLTIFL